VFLTLDESIDEQNYLAPYSDVAALLVFDHQMQMMNLLVRMGWEGKLVEEKETDEAAAVLRQTAVRRTIERLILDLQPTLVGLSVMTFQRGTARRIISLVRALAPGVRIAVGGYDPSLAPQAWIHPDLGVDFETAMQRLPPGMRQIFVLHDIEGYKHDEIAAMLGIAQGTSKSQLHRVRMVLRKYLGA
jgi:hypothetical protein